VEDGQRGKGLGSVLRRITRQVFKKRMKLKGRRNPGNFDTREKGAGFMCSGKEEEKIGPPYTQGEKAWGKGENEGTDAGKR